MKKIVSPVAGFRRFIAVFSTIFSLSAAVALAVEPTGTLPVQRTLTSADGRKLDVTITEKTADGIKGKTSAGKQFKVTDKM